MIFILRNGKQDGPFTETEVRNRLMAREFALTDLAWNEGLPSWIPISTLLGIIPPPIPPSPLNQAQSPSLVKSNLSWLDAPVEIFCPKCGAVRNANFKIGFPEMMPCTACGSKSKRSQWTIHEVDTTLTYSRTWRSFFFSSKGRLNRRQFFAIWLAFCAAMTGWFFCCEYFYHGTDFVALGLLGAVAFFFTCGIASFAQRLHDRGIYLSSGKNLVILFAFGALVLFVAVFRRGDDDCNMFGPPTKRIVTGNKPISILSTPTSKKQLSQPKERTIPRVVENPTQKTGDGEKQSSATSTLAGGKGSKTSSADPHGKKFSPLFPVCERIIFKPKNYSGTVGIGIGFLLLASWLAIQVPDALNWGGVALLSLLGCGIGALVDHLVKE